MAESIEITDEMRAAVGRQSDPWPYEVTTTGIRSFARGVGYTDPVYFDAAAAADAGYDALPAPVCYLGTPMYLPGRSNERFSTPVFSRRGLGHGLKDVLDGGTDTVYERPLRAGDELTARTAVVDLEVKQSKALGAFLLVTSETVFTDDAGLVAARQRSQAIFY
ncbi:MAG: FAS1-like dehydratase domain-containing protein [Acidimicrobiales bacterium]